MHTTESTNEKIQTLLCEGIHPVIVIYGPTGCGKTALSLTLAEKFHGEVISVDSRQIYRGMDIGTGKILHDEMCGIAHHMLNIINPDTIFSVVEYRTQASRILEEIGSRGKVPILCGGTGLYLDSLIFERSYSSGEPDWSRRRELEDIASREGKEYVWKILEKLDSGGSHKIHPNNIHGVIRAIEVIEKGGKPKSCIHDKQFLLYPTIFFTPYDGDRVKLYENINLRVETMFSKGLIKEVKQLRRNFPDAPGLSTIGYKEVCEYLDGKVSLKTSMESIKLHTRNYAKRQITWNKKYEVFL